MKCTRICLMMSRDTQAGYKSMKPYIDIATRTKSDAMAKIAASWEEEKMANILRKVGK